MTRQNAVTVRWGWMLVALGIAALGAVVLGFASGGSCASGADPCTGVSAVDTVQSVVIVAAAVGGVAWACRRAVSLRR
ncbi:hypothetical protein [Demequina phytophila]|uniref:hypothetical protein n=1 Tax=Demequina phytophila TaxID=1638981 RepID=UPI0007851022|nr:hypothetical protein [Demequina phytophila]